MANGILASLPPGLRGMLASEQMAQQRSQNELQQLGGILSLQNTLSQQQEMQQSAPLRQARMQAELQAIQNPAPERIDLGGAWGLIDKRTGQVVAQIPKTATADTLLREQGAMQRHQQPSGSALLGEQGAMQRHLLPSGSTLASNQVAMRGQNMTDARARETLAQGRWQYDASRGGLINLQTGEFRPATQGGTPIGAPEKPLTEAQGRATLFGSRATESDKILQDLEKEISTTGLAMKRGVENMWGVGPVAGAAGNVLLSQNQQKVEQAQRDFVNAVLRQESGAVISPQEFENAQKQYFPQPGDGPQVIEQKRRNRQTAIQGLGVMAGKKPQQTETVEQPQDRRQQRRTVVDY